MPFWHMRSGILVPVYTGGRQSGLFENIAPGIHIITHEISGQFLSERFPNAGFYILEKSIGLYTKEDKYLGKIEYQYTTSKAYQKDDFIQ